MFQKENMMRTALVSLLISGAVVGVYHKAYVSKRCVDKQDMSKLTDSIEPVLWNIIRQNPDAFFKVMNEAAQAQQEKMKDDLEKSATQSKDQLLNAGIKLGSNNPDAVQFVAFVDMMDPVSHEFEKVALRVMREKSDVSFRLIPLAVNGLNSEVMARFVLSANLQKAGSMAQFLENFLDKMTQMTRAKLLDTAKAAGFDIAQIEKGEGDKKVEEDLNTNMKLADSLKVQGTPTVYVVHHDGKLTLVPPMDVGGFLDLAQAIRVENGTKAEAQAPSSPVVVESKVAESKPVEAVVEPKVTEVKAPEVKDAKADTKAPAAKPVEVKVADKANKKA